MTAFASAYEHHPVHAGLTLRHLENALVASPAAQNSAGCPDPHAGGPRHTRREGRLTVDAIMNIPPPTPDDLPTVCHIWPKL